MKEDNNRGLGNKKDMKYRKIIAKCWKSFYKKVITLNVNKVVLIRVSIGRMNEKYDPTRYCLQETTANSKAHIS